LNEIGWQDCRLRDVCTLKYGKGLPERERSGSGYPVVGAGGVVGYHESALIEGPAIIVGRKGSAGSVTFVESDCWPIDTTYWVEADSSRADFDFVRYLLEYLDLPRFVTTTAIPGINRETVLDTAVLLPPLAQQRRIADLLSVADQTIRALVAAERRVSALIEAETASACPTSTSRAEGSVPLDDLAKYVNGRAFKPGEFSLNGDGLPVIRIKQLLDATVSPDRFNGPYDEKHFIDDGDIILSWSATLAVERWSRGPALLNQHLFKVSPGPDVDPSWLMFVLRSALRHLQQMTHGTTMKHITRGELGKVFAPKLSPDDQRSTVESLTMLMEEGDLRRTQRATAERLRASLLQSLLAGVHRIPDSYDRFLADENPDSANLEPATV
jgi:type I restriction enzyme S subunit